MRSDLIYVWEEDPTLVPRLVELFLETLDPTYISFGEIQEGRAVSAQAWHPDLRQRLTDELTAAVAPGSTQRILVAWNWQDPVGVALVKLCLDADPSYAVLEDLVIRGQDQRQGIGRQMVDRVVLKAHHAGCRHLYMESGVQNHGVHLKAADFGFRPLSQTYVRDLEP